MDRLAAHLGFGLQLRLRLTGLPEEITKPIARLGVFDFVGVVAVYTTRLFEIVRATGVFDVPSVADEELEDDPVSLAACHHMGTDRAEGPIRAILGIAE
jgi:hypothetical protein